MKKVLFNIGQRSKLALQENISEKIKNKVLKDYCYLINKNKSKILGNKQKNEV